MSLKVSVDTESFLYGLYGSAELHLLGYCGEGANIAVLPVGMQ